jgi:hypothetical protein
MDRRTWKEIFRRLEARRAAVERFVREAVFHKDRATTAGKRVDAWEKSHAPGGSTPGETAIALLMPWLLAGIACGDFMLARPTAVWLAVIFGEREWQTTLVWSLPTTLFLLDVLVGVLLDRDRRRAAEGDARSWTTAIVAGVLLTALPAFSLAAQLSVQTSTHVTMFWLRTSGLVALSFLLHGVVVFGGRLIIESLDVHSFLIVRAVRRHVERRERRRQQRAQAYAFEELAVYDRLFHEFAAEFERRPYGPFSADAVTLLGLDLSALRIPADASPDPALDAVVGTPSLG